MSAGTVIILITIIMPGNSKVVLRVHICLYINACNVISVKELHVEGQCRMYRWRLTWFKILPPTIFLCDIVPYYVAKMSRHRSTSPRAQKRWRRFKAACMYKPDLPTILWEGLASPVNKSVAIGGHSVFVAFIDRELVATATSWRLMTPTVGVNSLGLILIVLSFFYLVCNFFSKRHTKQKK